MANVSYLQLNMLLPVLMNIHVVLVLGVMVRSKDRQLAPSREALVASAK